MIIESIALTFISFSLRWHRKSSEKELTINPTLFIFYSSEFGYSGYNSYLFIFFCWLVGFCSDFVCPKGLKNLRCTLCRSMYWFSFQLAIIVDRYYPHFIRYAPSTRIACVMVGSIWRVQGFFKDTHQTYLFLQALEIIKNSKKLEVQEQLLKVHSIWYVKILEASLNLTKILGTQKLTTSAPCLQMVSPAAGYRGESASSWETTEFKSDIGAVTWERQQPLLLHRMIPWNLCLTVHIRVPEEKLVQRFMVCHL